MTGLFQIIAAGFLLHSATASVKSHISPHLELQQKESESSDVSTDSDADFSTMDVAIKIKEMMEKIDTVTGAGSNGTSQVVKETLDGMMADFKTIELSKFSNAFKHTQADINANVAKFEDLNTKAVKAKDNADARNNALAKCRMKEKKLLEVQEECAVDGHWQNKSWTEACQAADDAQIHDWSVSKALTEKHRCDLSQDDCVKLEALSDEVDAHYAESQKQRDIFRAKTLECSRQKNASIAQEADCEKKLNAFRHQRAVCDQAEFDLKMSTCNFGESLQAKCGQYAKLTELVSKVRDGHDTDYSEADRRTHWLQGHALQCMLKSYTDGGTIDDTVRNLCESQSDYEKEVGTMDYQSERINACVRPSPPMFTCNESTVLFEGPVWTTGNASSLYSEEPVFNTDLTLTPVGAGAFSWCQAKDNRGNCRGFSCEAPWKPKPDMASIHCTLTECSEYECCVGSGSAALPAAAAGEPAAAAGEPAAAAPAAAAAAPAAAEASLAAKKAKPVKKVVPHAPVKPVKKVVNAKPAKK